MLEDQSKTNYQNELDKIRGGFGELSVECAIKAYFRKEGTRIKKPGG